MKDKYIIFYISRNNWSVCVRKLRNGFFTTRADLEPLQNIIQEAVREIRKDLNLNHLSRKV